MSRVSVPAFPPPHSQTKVDFVLFFLFLYKMILDDESDRFRDEVSSRRNSRDETHSLPFMHS